MKSNSGYSLLFVAISGCASQLQADDKLNSQSATAKDESMCAVAAEPSKYIGREVRLAAHYKTDSEHYEFLIDNECGRSVLNVQNIGVTPSESLKSFYDESTKKCNERHEINLCVIEADLDVTVRVIGLPNGKTGVDLLEVHSYSFDE